MISFSRMKQVAISTWVHPNSRCNTHISIALLKVKTLRGQLPLVSDPKPLYSNQFPSSTITFKNSSSMHNNNQCSICTTKLQQIWRVNLLRVNTDRVFSILIMVRVELWFLPIFMKILWWNKARIRVFILLLSNSNRRIQASNKKLKRESNR